MPKTKTRIRRETMLLKRIFRDLRRENKDFTVSLKEWARNRKTDRNWLVRKKVAKRRAS